MIVPKFLCLGDSITEYGADATGWVTALQLRYVRKLDVVNRGCSGYNTRWFLELLPSLLSQRTTVESPLLLTIVLFGSNDSASKGEAQYVPIGEYEANIEAICKAAIGVGSRVILITPVPVDHARFPTRTMPRTRTYCDAVIAVAHRLNVPFVDTWLLEVDLPLGDGLHLSPRGNANLE